jgi:UDP-glucose 4-epimerase
MKVAVTGGFGFIGSNLVKRLLSEGQEVIVFDNLSTGSENFLSDLDKKKIYHANIDLAKASVYDLTPYLKNVSTVYHLAANADVRGGWTSTFRDIEENIIASHNIALASRESGVTEFIFASTGCVYGDSKTIPTPETEIFPIQTSLYGASKVASEGLISRFAANGAFKATAFRFVSVLGPNYHHGHVIDFVRKLKANPTKLNVLGNGKQKKSYIHVTDCETGLIKLRTDLNYDVFNIGHNMYVEVRESAKLVADSLNLTPEFIFENKDRGWIGDNPFTFLDIQKATKYGWQPSTSIELSVQETVDWIENNSWVLDKVDRRS